jgi:hypothetical protein
MKILYAGVLLALVGCVNEGAFDWSQINDGDKKRLNIKEVRMPVSGCINKSVFSSEVEISKLIYWLRNNKEIILFASYPDTINLGQIVFKDGGVINFHLSTPFADMDYVIVSINGEKRILQKFPFC